MNVQLTTSCLNFIPIGLMCIDKEEYQSYLAIDNTLLALDVLSHKIVKVILKGKL